MGYKKFVNEAVIDIQNLENISPIPKPQKKIAQVEDVKHEEKYNGFELSPHGQEDQSYDMFLDIMEIAAKYEDGCETAFVYGTRIYISNQCLITLWRRNYIVNA